MNDRNHFEAEIRELMGESGMTVINIDEDVNAVRVHKHEQALTRTLPRGDDPKHIAPTGATMSDIIKNLEDTDLNSNLYLQNLILALDNHASRLRHRADMMRRRANEFDELADRLDRMHDPVTEQVRLWDQHLEDVEALLKEHAHVEPKGLKP